MWTLCRRYVEYFRTPHQDYTILKMGVWGEWSPLWNSSWLSPLSLVSSTVPVTIIAYILSHRRWPSYANHVSVQISAHTTTWSTYSLTILHWYANHFRESTPEMSRHLRRGVHGMHTGLPYTTLDLCCSTAIEILTLIDCMHSSSLPDCLSYLLKVQHIITPFSNLHN